MEEEENFGNQDGISLENLGRGEKFRKGEGRVWGKEKLREQGGRGVI
jgi:hypothetical protein